MRIEAHKTTNTVEFCIRKNTHNIPTGTIYLYTATYEWNMAWHLLLKALNDFSSYCRSEP